MNVLYVRWIGAFGRSREGLDLEKVIRFEMNPGRQMAVESILSCAGKDQHRIFTSTLASRVDANFGVVYGSKEIVARFKGDVWSRTSKAGALKATHAPHYEDHTEAWTRQGSRPSAFVVPATWGQWKASVLKKVVRTLVESGCSVVHPVYEDGERRDAYKSIDASVNILPLMVERCESFTKETSVRREANDSVYKPQNKSAVWLSRGVAIATNTKDLCVYPRPRGDRRRRNG